MMLRALSVLIVTTATVVSASAQTELSGTWSAIAHEDGLERGAGPYAVDYTGLPLNAEHADVWIRSFQSAA